MRAPLAFASPFRRGTPGMRGRLFATSSALLCAGAQAFSISITPGTRSLFLQVGSGTMTGGNFSSGGMPGNNSTISRVSVTIPAANLGTGSVAMTTDSTVTASPYNGFAVCTVPAQVYVGGFYRTPGTAANATLTATTPTSLTSSDGSTIPFSTVSWVSVSAPPISNGTFAGGTSQTLASITRNTWFESCLQFSYANTQLVGSGTFTGRATYTLTAP